MKETVSVFRTAEPRGFAAPTAARAAPVRVAERAPVKQTAAVPQRVAATASDE
ncbi:hypothetical protein AB4Y38_25275 [Paraburkholderia sp. EG285A]|uniref:hypothetical protein n=1 Tax=Paraburkholderia sp. EG285A TaxID=3237009 RepID=UPI0034D25036